VKLLFCRACGDIVKLLGTPRACRCGKAYGLYVSDREVTIYGEFAEVIGADNKAVEEACRKVDYNLGPLELNEVSPLEFAAWFYHHSSEIIKRVPWPG
jgi:hypothetical protein